METKSFKEIVPVKKLSSGPTNSANKQCHPSNQCVFGACLRGFFSEKINLDISLYLTARSQILCVAVLRTVGECAESPYAHLVTQLNKDPSQGSAQGFDLNNIASASLNAESLCIPISQIQ